MTVQDAIDITMKEHNYPDSIRKQIIDRLLNGDYSVITRNKGARDFVSKLKPSQIQLSLFNFANIEDTIDDMLSQENINEKDKKSYIFRRLSLLWRDRKPYILKNGTIFTLDILKDYMIKGMYDDASNIRSSATVLRRYDPSNIYMDVNNYQEALNFLDYYKDSPETIDKAINYNHTLSGALLNHAISYYYFDKSKNVIDSIISIANKSGIDKKTLITYILNDSIDQMSLSFELKQQLNSLDKNKIKIELILNSIYLYRYSGSSNGISNIEARCYDNKNQTLDIVQEYIGENNYFVRSLKRLSDRELKETIKGLTDAKLLNLIDLYVNSHSSLETKKIVEKGKISKPNSETYILENRLKSKELENLLKQNKRLY